MEKGIFVAGGLVNWPDATPEELRDVARETEEAINLGLYENEDEAIRYYLALIARIGE